MEQEALQTAEDAADVVPHAGHTSFVATDTSSLTIASRPCPPEANIRYSKPIHVAPRNGYWTCDVPPAPWSTSSAFRLNLAGVTRGCCRWGELHVTTGPCSLAGSVLWISGQVGGIPTVLCDAEFFTPQSELEGSSHLAYRYLGNKTRLLTWLIQTIQSEVPSGLRFADPMCGTAAVSEALANTGYSVSASDSLTFPVLHAKARLLFSTAPDFDQLGGYSSALKHLNNIEPMSGYFVREFSPGGEPEYGGPPRAYFTTTNAAKIDAIRAEIACLHKDSNITSDEKDLLLHDLALAVNHVANITGTYGYFRSSWNEQSLSSLTLVCEKFSTTPGSHVVQQGNASDVLSEFEGDACYLDPPYTKRQYSGNYHILETIAVGDEPFARGAGGLRDWTHQASDFCYKRRAPGAFEGVLKELSVPHLFVSYSEDGQVSPDDLYSILESYGKVRRFELELPRFKSNSRGASGTVKEHLYHVIGA